ncbi:phospholipase A and acyltransferase 3-like isoform X2 [Haliotis rubra]|uniref:phospholipase A and acyltransferase 3-like isoform X2 n=1 Tax=Haliotis rubra TaxID=36100 RepID=UPI001EE616EA|nr:phospholipase A and acyltransferase 3-like isoform X2 [Haliotis rubra]
MAMKASIQHHNDAVLSSLEPGDQVEFKRGVYSHWGVYIGDGYVIHLASPDGQSLSKTEKAVVRRDKIKDVAANSKMYKNNSKGEKYGLKAFSKSDIVKRAKSQLGREGYNLLASNCEHFVSWCCYDIEISDQVDDRIELTAKAAKMFFSWLQEKGKHTS